ncbi:hypothetical protein PAECIP111891_06025 [Paenibacillus allorhizoplanae]|uniref:SGNH hydrolase-type esterase domain-containing protein n=1 Tax=Paenibacillus allorhizoplanae TaxID=2905648 RepID=A0ABM9CYD2_9BACL|nr:GDSL-type esterase/lipase family protein [Paenibacillus allorhizoplanae]CAH1226904.1 hypothetical protein PAECIP111891_06025 [Paenibacillus allorhizoplanae]
MQFESIELHNVAEAEENKLTHGLTLQRYPKAVREAMSERGGFVSQQASGCEIRFVTNSQNVRISLTAVEGDGEVMVYQGDFYHSQYTLRSGVQHTLHLVQRLDTSKVNLDSIKKKRFAPQVWRVITGRYAVRFHGIEVFNDSVRPPLPDEVPAVRWLAYGSSITHGSSAVHNYNAYVHKAAQRLGIDVMNMGLSGACMCEPQVANYLSSRTDWDLATLEIGVNMRTSYSPEQFRERAEYLIQSMCSKHPNKPVVVITIFLNASTYDSSETTVGQNQAAFNAILREIVASSKYPKLYLLEGNEILTDFAGLTCDLIHPSDYGHELMGENLSRLLRPILEK